MTFYAQMPSPLGQVLLRSDGQALTGVFFIGQKDCPAIDGLAGARPQRFDPTAGLMAGAPIKKFKAYKHDGQSGDLFDDPCPDPVPDVGQLDVGELNADDLLFMQEQTLPDAMALFRQTQIELHEYFAGRRQVFDVPLALVGTEFQKKVWRALLDIPYGQVVSYGDVARAAGLSAQHGRPVGTAVGRNPITILIPCHRVLSSTGTLTGYSGGLDRKFSLLELEGFLLR